DETGQAVDGRKAQREVLAPASAHDTDEERRRVIGALEHMERRRDLAAAIGYDAHVAREQLRQRLEIARARCRHECGQELSMLRIDLARMRRRRGGAGWSRCPHVRACA